ncbi:MAG: ATP-binding cassette domain-containing protein [Bifidobacterium aquikefiri]|uniref:Multidrug ABC transporter ATP-binding protein n=1 Tax=Bifidobacterium aquikefiri TaxID=1653207 RepID=A0A261G109_9BIFI|nr:ATP-binding cassette domain-containing protein [Bifidobacterium aquikefiri]OZG65111.1 multidrug ABC transporter ATP-binding protein [Bifidobacterium aquikefiri]
MHITAQNLSKHYGKKLVVDNASFTVHDGKVTGFLGPNGAGKSTTMRMLLGLHRPDGGNVLFDGKPLTSFDNPLQIVGSLLDAKAFNPRNTPHQYLLAQAATHGLGESRVKAILRLTGLSKVADKEIGGFSLGMSQRLGMANALLADPQVLILDEPINGLDPEGVRWVRETLKTLASEGRTILISSHLMAEMAQTADHIIVIGKGRILADAPVDEIISGKGFIRVRSPQMPELLELLASRGIQAQSREHDCAIIAGVKIEEVGRIAAAHRFILFELAPIASSLEDAYLNLTADAVEYKSGATA